MNSVISALTEALKSLIHPKMLVLIIWPMLLSLLVWVLAAMIFWGSWVGHLTELMHATPIEKWVANGFLAIASHYFVTVVLLMLLMPAIYVTALLLTAFFAMPMMVNHVALQQYPALEYKKGGSTMGSVLNSMVAISVYGLGWILVLPLWLFSFLAIVLPIILLAYLNQRLFRYDALAEHASADEFKCLVAQSQGRFYFLGAAVACLQFIPVLNLFLPVYVGLVFIHFSLSELAKLRQAE